MLITITKKTKSRLLYFTTENKSQTTAETGEGRRERGEAQKTDQRQEKSCIYFLIPPLLVAMMSAVTKGI